MREWTYRNVGASLYGTSRFYRMFWIAPQNRSLIARIKFWFYEFFEL